MGGTTLDQVAACLSDGKEQTDLSTGEVRAFGRVGNLQVSVCSGGLFVVGSLPKYLHGNNIYPLDRHATEEAITKLQDTLHTKMSEARVTELEFGGNFWMKHPVSQYLDRMGAMPRLLQCRFPPATLYYKHGGKNKPKEICFYDKGAEEKAKGMTLPKGFEEANWLRYELRYKGRLPHNIGFPKVEAATLFQKDFYRLMVQRYQDFYFSIQKINQIKTNIMDEIKTVRDAKDVFIARLISQSTTNQIAAFLEELKEAHVFADSKYYTRLKQDLQRISRKANVTETDTLIRELDDDVRNVSCYV